VLPLQLFHVPLETAAELLGVKLTVFKKHLRTLDIHRWPHRKFASLANAQVSTQCSSWGGGGGVGWDFMQLCVVAGWIRGVSVYCVLACTGCDAYGLFVVCEA
jgi:hypothetical protein